MMSHVLRFKQLILFANMLLFLLCQSGVASAAQDSKGRDFWITFMQNLGSPTLQLFITSNINTKGRVEIPGLAWSTNFTVTSDVTTTVSLPSSAVLSGTGIQNKGIHVIADDEVTVYGLNRVQYTTDAFMALPVDALNLKYYVMSYANTVVHNSDAEEFAIVAAFDNTNIQFSLPDDSSQDLTLNKGQVYQYLRPGTNGHKLTGTYIQSDKPIAVFGGNTCTNIPWYMNIYACDHVEEQLPPLAAWGKEFYTVPLATRRNGDTFVVVAGSNGTGVDVNGERKATLNAGQLYEQIIQGNSIIKTTAPSLLAQYSNSSDYDGVTSDPFMMLVPPVEQSLSHYTFSTPGSGFAINYVNVVAPTSAVSSIKLDGTTVNQQLFTTIPGTTFSGGQIPVSVGSHTMDGLQRFGIHSYGYASYDSYGYPGGMAFEVINPGVINIAPATLNVGTFDANNIFNVNEVRTLRLLNEGNTLVTINNIALQGSDYSDYTIVSVNGFPVNNTSYTFPFTLWPYGSMEIKVALNPQHTPIDAKYDAALTVTGTDSNGYAVGSVATLIANLSSTSLAIDILDASPTIAKFDSSSAPISYNGKKLDEKIVSEIKIDQKRVGIVADGNARLLLRSKINKTSGYVTFNIKQPSDSEAKISGTNFSSNNDSQMHTSITVPVVSVNGNGQATAILRAAEKFSAGNSKSEANIDIEVCYQEQSNGACLANDEIRVMERRAPVLLVHGIWADDSSWQSGDTKNPGVAELLENSHFDVGYFIYDNWRGPSEVMLKTTELYRIIREGSGSNGLCDQVLNKKYACTRADIIAHSMGGLVARKFIYDNNKYKSQLNFENGAVRRLITLGTPNAGSQLANLLRYDNSSVNNCITDENQNTPGIQNEGIDDAIYWLEFAHNRVITGGTYLSGVTDLSKGSTLLNYLNGTKQVIPVFSIYGDSGTEFDFGVYAANKILRHKIDMSGCTYADVFGNGIHSDGIVPENSSTNSDNNFPATNTQEVAGVVHVGMGTNRNIANTVLPMLTAPLSRFANGI